jgi:hypothetical protein
LVEIIVVFVVCLAVVPNLPVSVLIVPDVCCIISSPPAPDIHLTAHPSNFSGRISRIPMALQTNHRGQSENLIDHIAAVQLDLPEPRFYRPHQHEQEVDPPSFSICSRPEISANQSPGRRNRSTLCN